MCVLLLLLQGVQEKQPKLKGILLVVVVDLQ